MITVSFKLMITFPSLLKERIEFYNKKYRTDFRVVVIEEEVHFCVLQVSKYTLEDIFNLGYGLALKEYPVIYKIK